VIALVAFAWPSYARLIRGDVLTIKQRDFVLAARTLGILEWRILLRHILPNAMYTLLVVATLDIGTYVLSFAALSFLGLGAEQGYCARSENARAREVIAAYYSDRKLVCPVLARAASVSYDGIA
jgi:ABC-type microcin C transport system permease subunit YejE